MSQLWWLPATRQLTSLQRRLLVPKLLENNKRFLSNGGRGAFVPSKSKAHQPRTRSNRPPRPNYHTPKEERPLDEKSGRSAPLGVSKKDASLLVIQGDVRRLLRDYHAKLFGEQVGESVTSDSLEIFEAAKLLHKQCLKNADKIEFHNIQDTDNDYRALFNMIQKYIHVTMLSETQPSLVAEHLLRTLLLLRSDRDRMLQQTHIQEKEPVENSGLTGTLMGWVRGIFVSSNDDEVKNQIKFKEASIKDRIPDAYIERTRKEIASAVYNAVPFHETNHAVLLDRAVRLISLMDIGNEASLSQEELGQVIMACGAVGTIDMAIKVEGFWRNNENACRSPTSLHGVLRAYVNAAKGEIRRSSRREASARAEKLVLGQAGSFWQDYGSKCTAVSLALEALACEAAAAAPAICNRAENLIVKCIGRRPLHRMLSPKVERNVGDALSEYELQMLHHLMAIYAGQRNLEGLERATQCLESMECNYLLRQTDKSATRGRRAEKQSQNGIVDVSSKNSKALLNSATPSAHQMAPDVFPSVDTYRLILNCIWHLRDSKITDAERLQMAKYATGLLDSMDAISIKPEIDMFDQLLKIWLQVRSIECDEYADKILAKMELREIYDPDFRVSSENYKQALRCWRTSAQFDHPLAAERGTTILRFMEAQSGVLCRLSHPTRKSSSHDPAAVYNDKVTPDIEAYDLVLNICTNSNDCLDFALEAHAHICQTEIQPTATTYADLFLCLAHHLPGDSPRRSEVAAGIMREASLAGKLDAAAWKVVEGFDKELCRKFKNDSN